MVLLGAPEGGYNVVTGLFMHSTEMQLDTAKIQHGNKSSFDRLSSIREQMIFHYNEVSSQEGDLQSHRIEKSCSPPTDTWENSGP